jgi:hypothetical protein
VGVGRCIPLNLQLRVHAACHGGKQLRGSGTRFNRSHQRILAKALLVNGAVPEIVLV